MADPDYITTEQVAALLHVTPRHARRACQKAHVRTQPAGKRVLFNRLDVESLAIKLGAEYRQVESTPTPAGATEQATADPSEPTPTAPPGTAIVPYDALQHEVVQLRGEVAELKQMLATVIERLPATLTSEPAPGPPATQPEPRRLSLWERLIGRLRA